MSQMPVRKRAEGGSESTEVVIPVDLLSRDDPRSVINIVSAETQAHIFRAYTSRPDLFRMGEVELRRACKPTVTDNRLRLAFWNEHNLAQENGTTMRMTSVYAGVCTRQFFETKYLSEPVNIAWMLCPPASYIIALEEIVARSQTKLSEILDAEVVDEDGKVDVKLGELILKINVAAEARLKGSVLVRKHITGEVTNTNKNLNVNANVDTTPEQAAKVVDAVTKAGSIADVNARLAKLRKEEEKAARKRVADGGPNGPSDENTG
jgi:hypothetical protein